MSSMVRLANLDADGPLIIEFLRKNHTTESTPERFEWLYRRGPAGAAKAWILVDTKTSMTIGVAAAFPRRLYAHGQEVRGWVLGDFCIEPGFRSVGPAMRLQQTCVRQLQSESRGVFYDFPSPAMTAVYRRLNVFITQQFVRLVKPLRVDSKIQQRIKQPQLARALTAVVNHGLSVFNKRDHTRVGDRVVLQHGRCKEEFTKLAHRLGSNFGICSQRSADYLNWRFCDHPYRHFEFITRYDQNHEALLGYAVISKEGNCLHVVDLFGYPEDLPFLLRTIVSAAQERELESVAVGALDPNPAKSMFRKFGFFSREKFPVVAHFSLAATSKETSNWFLTDGDRES
jgi:hypothetical protein